MAPHCESRPPARMHTPTYGCVGVFMGAALDSDARYPPPTHGVSTRTDHRSAAWSAAVVPRLGRYGFARPHPSPLRLDSGRMRHPGRELQPRLADERRRVGVADIALASNGCRCIAHDRRDHGCSSRLWHGNDMDTYADDLNELFTALEVKGVTMIGHCTGGGNSMAWPEMRPFRISLGGSNSLIVSGSSCSVCPSFELAAQADRRIRCCCRRVPRGDGFDLAQAPGGMPGAQ